MVSLRPRVCIKTCIESSSDINTFAAFLAGNGISKGDFIAVFTTNSPEMIITILALSKLGAVSALINTNLRGRYHFLCKSFHADKNFRRNLETLLGCLHGQYHHLYPRSSSIGKSTLPSLLPKPLLIPSRFIAIRLVSYFPHLSPYTLNDTTNGKSHSRGPILSSLYVRDNRQTQGLCNQKPIIDECFHAKCSRRAKRKALLPTTVVLCTPTLPWNRPLQWLLLRNRLIINLLSSAQILLNPLLARRLPVTGHTHNVCG